MGLEEDIFCVNRKDYENLVRDSERYNTIKNAFFCCLRNTPYGDTINESYMIAVLASVCKDEYDKWHNSNDTE